MHVLMKKFPGRVITCTHPGKLKFEEGFIALDHTGKLFYNNGISIIVICEDVYAFTHDNKSIWYVLSCDREIGREVVWRVDADLRYHKRGVFDSDGNFLFQTNDTVYIETPGYRAVKLTDINALRELTDRNEEGGELTLNKVAYMLSCFDTLSEYDSNDFYRDIISLHRCVDELADIDPVSPPCDAVAAARLIYDTFKLCQKLDMNVISPFTELMRGHNVPSDFGITSIFDDADWDFKRSNRKKEKK